jgi:branched-chain amino acid transport system permease protein
MRPLEAKVIAAFLVIAAALPLFTRDQFFIHIMVMIFFYAILASSLNLTVGYVGELTLAHAAFLGIGAYTSAILSTQYGVSPLVCIAIAG